MNGEDDPRVVLAAERTLLAWIRTGLSMMGLGFVVARFGIFMRELAAAGRPVTSSGYSQWIGIMLVVLGAIACLVPSAEYLRLLRRIGANEPGRPVASRFGVVIAVVLGAVGLVMTAYLLFLGR